MSEAKKPEITLGDVYLSGSDSFSWKLSTGVAPYQTIASVHKSRWGDIEKMLGKPQVLKISDGRGRTYNIRNVYPLHEVPSSTPNQRSFLISDLRWLLPYKLVVRDYNHTRKTGDRNSYGDAVPAETQQTVDVFGYLAVTLKESKFKWTGRTMIEDVLSQLFDNSSDYFVDSFPLVGNPRGGGNEQNQLNIQNVSIRDSGDAAIARAMSFVPGVDCYVSPDGTFRIFDATNFAVSEYIANELSKTTWDGNPSLKVSKKMLRPSAIIVHYQRKVEVAFTFSDDWSDSTRAAPLRDRAYLENVIPTTDISTEVNEYDPELNIYVRKPNIRQGTYIRAYEWVEAMGEKTPWAAFPWEFDTIRRLWVIGDLEGCLGARADQDSDPRGRATSRVSALRDHLRVTFRVNKRFMDRVHEILPERVGVFDPVTGTKQHAGVWGQCCVLTANKALRITSHTNPTPANAYINIDNYPTPGNTLLETPISTALVDVVDSKQGILRVQWLPWINGAVENIIPCLLTNENNQQTVPQRDLGVQDQFTIVPGTKIGEQSLDFMLSEKCKLAIIASVIPAAPNNRNQLHQESVTFDDIKDLIPNSGKVEPGEGPVLHLFVPPSEASARFGYKDEQFADITLSALLGLDSDDPNQAGITLGQPFDGYEFVNYESEIKPHARAVAAEAYSSFLDMQNGRLVTEMPGALKIAGNITSSGVVVGSAPSAKTMAFHEFTLSSKTLDRFSILPESVRHLILGTLKE